MRYFASSISRQMQEVQQIFNRIETSLENSALKHLSLKKADIKKLEQEEESSKKLKWA